MNLRTRFKHKSILMFFLGLTTLGSHFALAQLVDCQQVSENGDLSAPGGCIAKSLPEQVGAGQGDISTPGSSIYLIKRDPFRSIRRGRQIFQRKFTAEQGQGPRVNASSTGDITNNRALGAGLADSCAACHGRPRGSAGFGGDVNTFPDSRDSPHLFGLGLVEMLADEMTADLRAIRELAIADATQGGGVIINADFESEDHAFLFETDSFYETNNPGYSRGSRRFYNYTTQLVVYLGGIDSTRVTGMSGAWQHSFATDTAGSAILKFNYQLTQSPNYEKSETSEILIKINDSEPVVVNALQGNGNGGSWISTGQQDYEEVIQLQAGNNTIVIGAYNSGKDNLDEVTALAFDNVTLFSNGNGSGEITRELTTKGVEFGSITARADGTVDVSNVVGVDEDLRVKPFFSDGKVFTIREFIVGALNDEMGLQAWDPILCVASDPDFPIRADSAAGFVFDPDLDSFKRPPVCSADDDADGDGVVNEIDPAIVDHLEFYLLNYFKPGRYRETVRTGEGQILFEQIECSGCHVANLTIEKDRRVADVETKYDGERGIFNDLFAEASAKVQTPIDDGDIYPQLLPALESFVVKEFYSDLKRHNLGPAFHERDFDGSRITEHVTEPLWGVGSTPPYGHDGRSINLDSVIRRHGGEAAATAEAYAELDENDQNKVIEFLQSLVLFPPDDTASNLDTGNPDSSDPQDPLNHGSINLGALFEIEAEGIE